MLFDAVPMLMVTAVEADAEGFDIAIWMAGLEADGVRKDARKLARRCDARVLHGQSLERLRL